jgi:HK97 family phage major capsid protein
MAVDAELQLALGQMTTETKALFTGLQAKYDTLSAAHAALQQQTDAIDARGQGRHGGAGGDEDLLRKGCEDSADFARLKEIGKGKATLKFETKTLISSIAVGSGTAGVLAPQLVGGIVPVAQRRLFLRDLLSRGGRVSGNSAYFIRETAFTNAASPQGIEGTAKAESAMLFDTVSRNVTTIAHWVPAARQLMDDLPALLDYVRRKLLFGLRYKEDQEILSGDGSAYHLTGLLTSATAFNTGLIGSTSWNKIDILRRALEQVEIADEIPAGFFVLNPADWADIELTKSNQGEYLIGEPGGQDLGPDSLWGKPIVVTNAISAGSFLCGSSEGAELFDRQDATIEISTEYSDYFVRNLMAILCECREVLAIYRPGSFVHGSLNSSPA